MTTVNNDYTNHAAAALNSARSQNNDLLGDTQERFLTLLVTQLQNQDPLNPMDNAEVTSQLAQLSTVSGINQLNDTLLALSGQMDVSQSMQAANLIGKEVLVPGTKIAVGDPSELTGEAGATMPFGIDVERPAAQVKVSISDNSGKVVREFDLDPMDAGVYDLKWDGKDNAGNVVPGGAYHAKVDAFDGEGNRVAASTLTQGTVRSVAYSSKGLVLDMGLAGTYSLLDIRKIM